jgi:hypothetical protein
VTVTAKAPATQMSIRRAIAAARKEGLHVLAIRADGMVLVGKDPLAAADLVPAAPLTEDEELRQAWENVKA